MLERRAEEIGELIDTALAVVASGSGQEERARTAAAEGDFTVCFCNPRSRRRAGQLPEALSILAGHRPPAIPVGYVRNAARGDERAVVRTLEAMLNGRAENIDMHTVVLVASSAGHRGRQVAHPVRLHLAQCRGDRVLALHANAVSSILRAPPSGGHGLQHRWRRGTMATTPPARTTDLREEIATAISTGRELGPEFDTELADSLATRMESETAPEREGEHGRPGSPTRNERTLKVAGWGTLGIVAAAWAAESTPEGMMWGILAVVAIALHVVRTWRS